MSLGHSNILRQEQKTRIETMKKGIVIGKFNPPHVGHQHLIQTAESQVDELIIFLCVKDTQALDRFTRRHWIQNFTRRGTKTGRASKVIVLDDDLPEENRPWADRVTDVLENGTADHYACGTDIDLVFTSEEWGDEWAEMLGAKHVMVDLDRDKFPIHASDITADLKNNFNWLVRSAKADLARHVVLIGPESSGKTTMAQSLADELGTVWVPEYGRTFAEIVPDVESWESQDFKNITTIQADIRNDAARFSSGIVISDTDELVTSVWEERYLNVEVDWHGSFVPDLYLVCHPDFDWVQDGTRESKEHRQTMLDRMIHKAGATEAKVVHLKGTRKERLKIALAAINEHVVFLDIS